MDESKGICRKAGALWRPRLRSALSPAATKHPIPAAPRSAPSPTPPRSAAARGHAARCRLRPRSALSAAGTRRAVARGHAALCRRSALSRGHANGDAAHTGVANKETSEKGHRERDIGRRDIVKETSEEGHRERYIGKSFEVTATFEATITLGVAITFEVTTTFEAAIKLEFAITFGVTPTFEATIRDRNHQAQRDHLEEIGGIGVSE